MSDRQMEMFHVEEQDTEERTPAMDWDGLVEDHIARIAGEVGPRTCLCGSTRFLASFLTINAGLSKWGVVVHSIAMRMGKEQKDSSMDFGQLGDVLDRVHRQKIDMSSSVLVLDVGGYVGSSTQNEIEYAKNKRMPVFYLSKMCNWREPELEWALNYAYDMRVVGKVML